MSRVRRAGLAAGLPAALLAAALPPLPAAAQEDPAAFVEFVKDFDANCVRWEGYLIMVRNTHPTRRIKVTLERQFMGRPTGDRSRSELAPSGEPDKLGCSQLQVGTQEWK
ncbi:MAG TPA: hypothetical protein VLC55_11790, partial [Burkholderiales bacterium]|nr:hypothetical protein [Burkholderiales bacterium]